MARTRIVAAFATFRFGPDRAWCGAEARLQQVEKKKGKTTWKPKNAPLHCCTQVGEGRCMVGCWVLAAVATYKTPTQEYVVPRSIPMAGVGMLCGRFVLERGIEVVRIILDFCQAGRLLNHQLVRLFFAYVLRCY